MVQAKDKWYAPNAGTDQRQVVRTKRWYRPETRGTNQCAWYGQKNVNNAHTQHTAHNTARGTHEKRKQRAHTAHSAQHRTWYARKTQATRAHSTQRILAQQNKKNHKYYHLNQTTQILPSQPNRTNILPSQTKPHKDYNSTKFNKKSHQDVASLG